MDLKTSSDRRFALLIDADNVSARYIKPILDELSKYGTVTVKRIYGDWTLTLHAKWKDALLENSITPIQQFGYTQGKNATDSTMIIDAMDILYSDSVDGFCIVSSDSDFTRLASRLRESGHMVIGMGEKKTPIPFRRACDVFTTLELLIDHTKRSKGNAGNGGSAPTMSKAEVEQAVVDIITDNQNNGKATGLGEVGSRMLKRFPDFDVRSYGTNLLSKLLEEFTRVRIIKDHSSVTVELAEGERGAEEAGSENAPACAAQSQAQGAAGEDAPGDVGAPCDDNPAEEAGTPAQASANDKPTAKPARRRRSRARNRKAGAGDKASESIAEGANSEAAESGEAPIEATIEVAAESSEVPTKTTAENSKAAIETAAESAERETSVEKPAQALSDQPSDATEAPAQAALEPPRAPQDLIRELVRDSGSEGIRLSQIGARVRREFKDFKVRDLGFAQLRHYIASIDDFAIEKAGRDIIVKLAE